LNCKQNKLEEIIKKTLHEELIKFTRNYPQIKSISKGPEPEGGLAYYFLVGKDFNYDPELKDKISELSLKIHNDLASKKLIINLYAWPANPEDVQESCGFLEECIWKR
tara:strand:- start:228 stop:551 length:324 start_codon:yes stop_codon:yes gene_type:complete